jgi:DNA-binding transcriptional regulator LsrR (DeoR family)
VDLSRSELAELAGISTETAIRTLSAFKERGYVDLEGHKIYLRAPVKSESALPRNVKEGPGEDVRA